MAQPNNPNQQDRRDNQQFGPASTPKQRPTGSQSRTDMEEEDDSLEPVEHYRKGEMESDNDIERPNESSTSSTRKINR